MGWFDLFNKFPTLDEISGSFGEWLTRIYSKKFPETLIINDVLISGADKYTSQIDLLIIGNKGIYIIEIKNFPEAKIYGNTNQSTWFYYNHSKKYDIYSPLKQNQKHVRYLKKFLKDFGDIPCFSIVNIICDDFKISGKIEAGTAICNSLPSMEEAIYLLSKDKPIVFDNEQKQNIFNFIKNHQIKGKEARAEHKQNVIEYKANLEKMKDQKICPYCKTELILRNGKYGEFYGCVNYPKCKYTLKV